MKLYTTYFAKLRYLPPDVIPISIAQFPPPGWDGLTYYPFAPDPALLRKYKQDGDWGAYVKAYMPALERCKPEAVVGYLRSVAHGQDVALVCFEKDNAHCHRSLVADWLTKAGYPCEEWE